MPATTPLGIPYPLGTDRVSDGDNAIQAVAQWLDSSIAFGAVTLSGEGNPGVGGSRWFSSFLNLAMVGGFTVGGAVGQPGYMTVPRKGYYHVTAWAQMVAGQTQVGNSAQLFIGDTSTVWAYGGAVFDPNTFNVWQSAYCQAVVQLAAGARVGWGVSSSGPASNGIAGSGQAYQCLTARLVVPLP